MSFTYSGDPSDNDNDAVRFLLGDTDDSDPQLQDLEVTYLLATFGGPIHAAAVGAGRLAAKFTRFTEKSIGKLKIKSGEKAKQYNALEAELRRLIGSNLADVFVGGLTVSGKETLGEDTDAVQPSFSIGQDDRQGDGNAAPRLTNSTLGDC